MKWKAFTDEMPPPNSLLVIKRDLSDSCEVVRYIGDGRVIQRNSIFALDLSAVLWLEIPEPIEFYREAERRILAEETCSLTT